MCFKGCFVERPTMKSAVQSGHSVFRPAAFFRMPVQTQLETVTADSEQRFRQAWVPDLESRLLRTRVWLHLYRFSAEQLRDPELVRAEVTRLAMRFPPPAQDLPILDAPHT